MPSVIRLSLLVLGVWLDRAVRQNSCSVKREAFVLTASKCVKTARKSRLVRARSAGRATARNAKFRRSSNIILITACN